MLVFYEIFAQRVYEVPLGFEPHTILDLGSFTGLSPLFFTLRYPNASIYCVEPDPENFAALYRNTASFPAIQRISCAVAGKTGERQLYISGTQSCGHSLYPTASHDRSLAVSCLTVNELSSRFGLASIDILKFDIEGAEREIFGEFPFRIPVSSLIGELHLSRAEEQAFARMFMDSGYDVALKRDEFLGLTMFRAVLRDRSSQSPPVM
jgi:FkbM family methyltransferase